MVSAIKSLLPWLLLFPISCLVLQPRYGRQKAVLGTNTCWTARILVDKADGSCEQVLEITESQIHRKLSKEIPCVVKWLRSVEEGVNRNNRNKLAPADIYCLSAENVKDQMNQICSSLKPFKIPFTTPEELKKAEVVSLVANGDAKNRIDLVFMGDGYQNKQIFLQDMKSLVDDMFAATTFSSVLPLLNIWAIYIPSNELGIGSGGTPKDTPFGLYRDGTELRGIYPSKSYMARQACKLTGKFACDYPSIIGNDPFYGGLGGEFVISTSSPTSGTIVLRHEMGHSMIEEGEEYDGGQVYDGPNAAKSIDSIGWKEWLSEPNNVREEKAALLVQDYSWYDLGKGPYHIEFKSENLHRWSLQISSSGMDEDGSLEVYLDGKKLDWNSPKSLDRTFTTWEGTNLGPGNHFLIFKQGTPSRPGAPIRQLCSVTMHEYALEPDYHRDDASFIGAYPVWNLGMKEKTYRPMDEFCLMRNMSSHSFCPVCLEGLWLSLLSRLSLIDSVHTACKGRDSLFVGLTLLPLARFRTTQVEEGSERYSIKWSRNGLHVKDFDDMTGVALPLPASSEEIDEWKVTVDFHTLQVRKPSEFLTAHQDLSLYKHQCS